MDYSQLEYAVTGSGEATITRCNANVRNLVVPEHLEGHPVTALGPDSFARLDALERIALPAHLREIAARAFAGCRNLKAVAFNEELARIGNGAFTNTALQALDLPASCTELAPRSLVMGPAPAGQPVRAYRSRLERISLAQGGYSPLGERQMLNRFSCGPYDKARRMRFSRLRALDSGS